MRVAVIGAGTMGGDHARLLRGLPEVDDVLVADADPDRAAVVAQAVGGRATSTEEALSAADAAIVATPAFAHADVVEMAVERGVPVLCEKPLTADLPSSIELTRRIEEAGAHVEMGFQRRHDVGFAAGRAAVADGTAGPVRLLRLTAFDPVTPQVPITAWPLGDTAPIFLHSSIHDFDFARWLTGEEVVEVTADGSRRGDARPSDPRGIESAVVTMRLSGGGLAVLEASWLHPSGYDIRAELLADGAHLMMGLSARTPGERLDGDGPSADAWSGYLERFEPAYRAELMSFLATCRGERPPASTARDGLEAMRIAVAATRAYTDRSPVRVDEVARL